MRRILSLSFAVLVAVGATACASGPRRLGGVGPGGDGSCDTCAATEVTPIANGDDARQAAAAAAATGGQEASNQPVMSDPVRLQPNTVWNRGAGPNTNSPTSTDVRSQAGAPSVNQGLVLPSSATASASVADNPAVKALLERLGDLRQAWKDAVGRGAMDTAATIGQAIDAAESRLLAASSAAGGGQHTTIYDLRGARVSQIVANGSKSGDGPGGAITPDTATAVGAATKDVVGSTMAGDTTIPEGPPSGLPAAPAVPR